MERRNLSDYILKPHQEYGLQENRRLYRSKAKGWCVTAVPGSGKTISAFNVAVPAANVGKRVFLYTHRIMLTSQFMRNLDALGIPFGVIAASQKSRENLDAMIQICSIQTVANRINKSLPFPDIVIVDEAHCQTGEQANRVFRKHLDDGAKIIGYTATPVGLSRDIYSDLVIAGTYQDMLDCNLHLPVKCYGPDQPDLSSLKPMASGEFTSEDDKRINRVPTIFGRVYEYWKKLNPDALPAVGFAPGVEEARWFVEEFRARGVPCAHIDAERIVTVEKNSAGKLETHEYESTIELRDEILDESESGKFKILWNRFVLREAIDRPAWYHAIMATSVGSVSAYLQMTGRILRYYEGYDHVILQDHGGNLDRHGMPNQEREWEIGCTNNSVHAAEVKERQKNPNDDAEPICCPKCCAYRAAGPQCHNCGYIHKKSVRMVRQIDGELIEKTGRTVAYKKPNTKSPDQKAWDSIYWQGKNSWMTFAQARGIFMSKNGYPPPEGLNNTPKHPDDWNRRVRDIKYWELNWDRNGN